MIKNSLKILILCSIMFLYTGFTTYAKDIFPERIISLSSAITEQLYLLGLGDKIIGNTIYCQRPESARHKKKVGTIIEVDIEKIVGLKPDLVLATPLTNPKAKEKLKNLGIEVITFPVANSFKEICEQFLELGKLTGREKEAQNILKKINEQIISIKQRVKRLSQPRVIVQLGAKPLHVVTRDSFINDFIEFAGGINIGPNGKSGLYSREKVLKDNPDVIIITTMGIAGDEEKKNWKRYKTISAVKNNRIYIVDSYKLCSPTPVSFVSTLEEIMKILHPDLKWNRK